MKAFSGSALPLLCLLFFFALAASGASGDCQLSDIRLESLSDRRDHLSWMASSTCAVTRYNVTVDHVSYQACESERRDANSRHFVTITSSLVLTNLHPYSKYAVTVRAENERGGAAALPLRKEVDTFPSMPETRPRESASKPNSFKTLIKFSWSAPRPEECSVQNGELRGYRTELWGLDPWVRSEKPIKIKSKPLVSQEDYANGLLPYTSYQLKVFVRNRINPPREFNPRLSLEMTARTKPRRPDPPTSIQATPSSSSSVHLRWDPTYPPTGEVLYYKVRYGVNGSSIGVPVIWKKSALVNGDQGCKGKEEKMGPRTPVCHVISDLDPETRYIVEIKTFNVGIAEGSEFSKAEMVRTTERNDGDATTTTSSSQPPTQGLVIHPGQIKPEESHSSALVIVLVLVAIIIILVVICTALIYNIKMRKLKMRYERNNAGEGGQGMVALSTAGTNSTYLPSAGTTTSYVQSWANQIQEIQSRRLPEPPPDKKLTANSVSSSADDDDGGELFDEIMEDLDGRAPDPPVRSQSTTDLGGYLQPTFLEEPIEKSPPENANSRLMSSVIPVASYEEASSPQQTTMRQHLLVPTEQENNIVSTSTSVIL